MVNKRLFDRRYGEGAFARLRSMLGDPGFAYQHIGNKFGLTRQYIAQLANELVLTAGNANASARYAVGHMS